MIIDIGALHAHPNLGLDLESARDFAEAMAMQFEEIEDAVEEELANLPPPPTAFLRAGRMPMRGLPAP